MKPSPIVAVIFAELEDDIQQAPRWFWPAMLCLTIWAAGGIHLVSRRHAALKAVQQLEAAR